MRALSKCSCVLLLASALAHSVYAQSAVSPAILELDHVSGRVRLLERRTNGAVDSTDYGLSRSIQLPRAMNLQLRVVNTNTGIYRVTTEASSTPSPAIAPLSAFLGKLGPYLPEIGMALAGPARPLAGAKQVGRKFSPTELEETPSAEIARIWNVGRRAEQTLLKVDEQLYGPRGLQETLTLTMRALEEMRSGMPVASASGKLRSALGLSALDCAAPAPRSLPSVQTLIDAMHDLLRARQELDAGLGALPPELGENWLTVRDTVAAVRTRVVGALGDFEPLVNIAYRVDQLATLTANACGQYDGAMLPISRLTGRTVLVQITPQDPPELNRIAAQPAQSYTITVVKKPFVRPSIGVALINIPKARFDVYSARAAGATPAAGAEVYPAALRDARFTWGASLGTTWSRLDFREKNGLALWIPELTLSAQPDVKAFGVGSGVSWSPVKLGVGMLWVKRTELSGLAPGQIIPSAQYLKTRERYGRPLMYWSLSFFGWPGLSVK